MRSLSLGYGPRLFAWYALASLVPIVVLGAALVSLERQKGADHALDYGLAQAAVIEEMAIAPTLRGVDGDLTQGISRSEDARLLEAVRLAINDGSVTRLWVRDFDGNVVFSDTNSPDGSISATDPDFVDVAAAGGTDASLVQVEGAPEAIRVLRPIKPETTGRAVGVLELHLPYAPIQAKVAEAARGTYWYLGMGLTGLYLVLAGVTWSSTRRLRRHAQEREHEALHDPLTGLPNRKLFRWRLEQMLRQEMPGAVILVDLDRFKEVNDVLGHHAGDHLLSAVARRLQDALRTDDTVARLGGDEFGLLLPGVRDSASAYELAAKAQAALAAELVLDGVSLVVEASFGIALHPVDALVGEELMRYADAAMYQAKRGTHGIMHHDKTYVGVNADRLTLQAEMRLAMETDQLRLHYQPKVDLRTGAVVGVEALVRWQHPQYGLLPPAEFLPAIEQTGLVDPLTAWVLDHALADCARWLSRGVDWQVAVNVSARNLDSTTFPDTVIVALAARGISPSRLQIEVTETALSMDQDTAAANLRALASHGVGVALDDFGVGYASLAHLRSLALSEVKVDRVFVSRVDDSLADREVIRSLVQLAHGLGLHVTAEGVENASTAEWLAEIGCDSAQGFHFSEPAPWAELLLNQPPTQPTSRAMEALL